MPVVRRARRRRRALARVLASCAGAQPIEVLWLGHATFRITSVTGKVIVIDPFVTTNPRTPAKYKDLAALGKVDLILVTHGHRDHMYDLSRAREADRGAGVANYELAKSLVTAGLLDAAKTPVGMNKGGTIIAARARYQDPYGAGLAQLVGGHDGD